MVPLVRMFADAHPSLCSGPPTASTTLALCERTHVAPVSPFPLVITIKKSLIKEGFFNGAAGENRTHDPTLTKGVLYH